MSRLSIRLSLAAIILLFAKNLTFCAEPIRIPTKFPDYSYEFVGKDKHEKLNRKVYNFNMKVNDYFIKPINVVWASIMPKYGIEHLEMVYDNVEFPVRFFSCLLQKDFKGTKNETKRFFINSTLGLGGFFDIAKNLNIEKHDEDMGQVLAHKHIKSGSYWVVPILYANGTSRDIIGKILNCPFDPSCYTAGPIAMAAKAVLALNKVTNTQPLIKTINSNFADPYEISKKLYGIDRFIKCENLDRKDVLAEKISKQNFFNISSFQSINGLSADVNLKNYNSQGANIDALRTVLFNDKRTTKSNWNDISLWNRSFNKKIKTGEIKLSPTLKAYKYRFLLQKNKKAPIAIIYPPIGEGRTSSHSVVMAKILYDAGYSTIIFGSSFQWEFVNSMPDKFIPGFPDNDAKYLRLMTGKILNNLSEKYNIIPERKILIGSSYGALTAIFSASQEKKDNSIGINKYICISPPINLLYAMNKIDNFSDNVRKNELKMNAAITAEKVLTALQDNNDKTLSQKIDESIGYKSVNFPITEDEAKIITSAVMKQKLSDLIYTLEKIQLQKKFSPINVYQKINNMSFYDFAKNYLKISEEEKQEIEYKSSLYSVADFLKTENNYKIYEAIDDYYSSPTDLVWLKNLTQNKSVYFNDGSHLGFTYRKEFLDNFRNDLKQETTNVENKNIEPKLQLIRDKKQISEVNSVNK